MGDAATVSASDLPAILAGLLVLASIFASLVAWGLVLWQRSPALQGFLSSAMRCSVTVPRPAVFLCSAWLCWLLLGRLMSAPELDPDPSQMLLQLQLNLGLSLGVWIVLLVTLFSTADSGRQLAGLGFHPRHMATQLGLGLLTFYLAFVPVYLVLIATSLLRTDETLHPLLKLLQQAPDPELLGLIWITAAVVAPLLEELVFRVILQSTLRELLSPSASILLSALIFAAVHEFPDSLGVFVLALALGAMYEWRRSYATVVAAHAAFNSYNLLLMTLAPDAV